MNLRTESGPEEQGAPPSGPRPPGAGAPRVVEGLINPSNVNAVEPPIATPRQNPISFAARPVCTAAPGQNWAMVLMLACLALGLIASVVQVQRSQVEVERSQVQQAKSRVNSLVESDSVLEAQGEDLGKLLADPRTRMVRLQAADGATSRDAVIAWNPGQQRGFLFCDQLPVLGAGVKYEIWANGNSQQTLVARFAARPGMSVYRLQPENPPKAVGQWMVSAGPMTAGQTPVLVGASP